MQVARKNIFISTEKNNYEYVSFLDTDFDATKASRTCHPGAFIITDITGIDRSTFGFESDFVSTYTNTV